MPHFLVRLARGPSWDASRPRRAQVGWEEHAAYLDSLVARGVVLLGGPVGDDVDSGDAVLAMVGDDEPAVRRALAGDPWCGSVLLIQSVEAWTLWLRALRDR